MPGSASYCSSLPPLSLLVAAGPEATGHFFPAVANTGATTRPAQLGLQVLCLYLHCSGSVRPLSRCCFLFRRHPNRSSIAGRDSDRCRQHRPHLSSSTHLSRIRSRSRRCRRSPSLPLPSSLLPRRLPSLSRT